MVRNRDSIPVEMAVLGLQDDKPVSSDGEVSGLVTLVHSLNHCVVSPSLSLLWLLSGLDQQLELGVNLVGYLLADPRLSLDEWHDYSPVQDVLHRDGPDLGGVVTFPLPLSSKLADLTAGWSVTLHWMS